MRGAVARAGRWRAAALAAALIAPAVVAVLAAPVSAGTVPATGAAIAALATANLGQGACSVNTAGTKGFGSSCTGNGGKPEFWCADFAKWVWAQSGVADTNWLDPAAGSFYTYGEQYGTLSSVPAVGDAAVFDYAGDGWADHVAIVTQVNPDGTIETVSGDWNGQPGSEAKFSSTSSVVLNDPPYIGVMGTAPAVMGMYISTFVAPMGVPVTPVIGGSSLGAGGVLTATQALTSPNGLYSLGFQADGDLVESLGTRQIWSAGTGGNPGDSASLQSGGDFVVDSSSGATLWSSGTSAPVGTAILQLRDDGSFSVSGASGPLWTQNPPTYSLPSPQTLLAGQQLVSANGFWTLTMGTDGNLVEATAGRPLWSTGTSGHPGAWAVMRADGDFVVYGPNNHPLWQSATGGHTGPFTLGLGGEAALVITGPTGPVWTHPV
jgi:CHAP domain